ncbi:hypothetical protein HZS_2052, partial [Henneguya salminicola]
EEILKDYSINDWSKIFGIYDKDWKLAQQQFSFIFDVIRKDVSDEVKLEFVKNIKIGICSETCHVRNIFISTAEDLIFSSHAQKMVDILNVNSQKLIMYYITAEDILESSFINVTKCMVSHGIDLLNLADIFYNLSNSLSENHFVRLIELSAIIVSQSAQFGDFLSKNETTINYLQRFSEFSNDPLSAVTLLEYYTRLSASSPNISTQYVSSQIIRQFFKILDKLADSNFQNVLRFLTNLYTQHHETHMNEIFQLLETCVNVETTPKNWSCVYVSFQSIIFMLSNKYILAQVYKSNNVFVNIVTFFGKLSVLIPTQQCGDVYQIFSHLFSEPSDKFEIALLEIFKSMMTTYKLKNLLHSFSADEQLAGLYIVLTVSAYSWSTTYLCEGNKSVVETMTDASILWKGSDNLRLRNDAILMFLNNPIMKNKIDETAKQKLHDILSNKLTAQPRTLLLIELFRSNTDMSNDL